MERIFPRVSLNQSSPEPHFERHYTLLFGSFFWVDSYAGEIELPHAKSTNLANPFPVEQVHCPRVRFQHCPAIQGIRTVLTKRDHEARLDDISVFSDKYSDILAKTSNQTLKVFITLGFKPGSRQSMLDDAIGCVKIFISTFDVHSLSCGSSNLLSIVQRYFIEKSLFWLTEVFNERAIGCRNGTLWVRSEKCGVGCRNNQVGAPGAEILNGPI